MLAYIAVAIFAILAWEVAWVLVRAVRPFPAPAVPAAPPLQSEVADARAEAAVEAGTVTVSIGLAAGTGGTWERPEAQYDAADAALYQAKADGRNRTCRAARVAAPLTGAEAA